MPLNSVWGDELWQLLCGFDLALFFSSQALWSIYDGINSQPDLESHSAHLQYLSHFSNCYYFQRDNEITNQIIISLKILSLIVLFLNLFTFNHWSLTWSHSSIVHFCSGCGKINHIVFQINTVGLPR